MHKCRTLEQDFLALQEGKLFKIRAQIIERLMIIAMVIIILAVAAFNKPLLCARYCFQCFTYVLILFNPHDDRTTIIVIIFMFFQKGNWR